MPRRNPPVKRELSPDPKHDSVLVTRFVNNLIRGGKRSTAEKIFYGALDMIHERVGADSLDTFNKAINNVKPFVEVRSRRVGGATYQVPTEVRHDRRTALAIRWLIHFAKARPEHTMAERLANEFLAASKGEGAAVKKREDTHRMAEANKAFAHFRW
jgi:small subunit ribosomal protein S7